MPAACRMCKLTWPTFKGRLELRLEEESFMPPRRFNCDLIRKSQPVARWSVPFSPPHPGELRRPYAARDDS